MALRLTVVDVETMLAECVASATLNISSVASHERNDVAVQQ
jgi:hypothetical protein